jgi:hypothetical protein
MSVLFSFMPFITLFSSLLSLLKQSIMLYFLFHIAQFRCYISSTVWEWYIAKIANIHSHMKSSIFWDIALCSSVKIDWHSRGRYCFSLQGPRASEARNQKETQNKFLFDPVHESDVYPKRRLTFTGLKEAPEVRTVHGYLCEILKSNIQSRNQSPNILYLFYIRGRDPVNRS